MTPEEFDKLYDSIPKSKTISKEVADKAADMIIKNHENAKEEEKKIPSNIIQGSHLQIPPS